MRYSIIYTTTSNKREAKVIAELLVKERLAACVNIFPINSVYRWKGRIEQAREWGMVVKTRSAIVSKVIKSIKTAHSYECPCIISLEIKSGNKAFLDWIARETKK